MHEDSKQKDNSAGAAPADEQTQNNEGGSPVPTATTTSNSSGARPGASSSSAAAAAAASSANPVVNFVHNNIVRNGEFDKASIQFGYIGMGFLLGFFIVGSYLKYTESFTLVQSSWIIKPLTEYTGQADMIVKFSDFLINLFWSFRLSWGLYWVLWWRSTMDIAPPKPLDYAAAAYSVALIPVMIVLQLILDGLSVTNAWRPIQIIETVFYGFFVVRFLQAFAAYKGSENEQDKDLVMAENIIWLFWLIMLEFGSLVALSIGSLVGANQDNVYFQSKFVQDSFTTVWEFGIAVSFLVGAYLMNHKIWTNNATTIRDSKGARSGGGKNGSVQH